VAESIFWESETHRGSIRCLAGTTADGKVCDLGIWVSATEKKTERQEHIIPYNSVDAALTRLAEKYSDFHIVTEMDVVAAFMEKAET
jgi:hypothetical protein